MKTWLPILTAVLWWVPQALHAQQTIGGSTPTILRTMLVLTNRWGLSATNGAYNANNYRLTSSTFSGYASPIGFKTNFQAFQFWIRPFDSSQLPSMVRVRLLEGTTNGTVLYDGTQMTPGAAANTVQPIFVSMPSAVLNTGQSNLWLEWFSDGKIGYVYMAAGTNGVPLWNGSATSPETKYATSGDILTTSTTIDSATNGYPIVWFYTAVDTYYKSSDQAWLRDATNGPMSELFTVTPSFCPTTNAVTTNAFRVYSHETSTFYGWGQPVGVQSGFSAAAIWVRGWNPSSLITSVRLRIKATNSSGAVMADATAPVGNTGGAEQLLAFDFKTNVANSAAVPLWVEYWADGKIGSVLVTTRTSLVSQAISAFTSTSGGPTVEPTWTTNSSPAEGFFVMFGSVDRSNVKVQLSAKGVATIGTNFAPFATIHLPTTNWVVEGRPFEIRFDNVVRSTINQSLLSWDVVCARGVQHEKYWSYTPFEITSITVTNGGSGYATAPTVSFTSANLGTGATATATISGGIVTAVTMTDYGRGYATNTTVVFTGGGGSGAGASIDFGTNSPLTATINCNYGDTTVASKTIYLVQKTLGVGSGATRKLLVIGDSTTAGGIALAELTNLVSGDVFKAHTIGHVTTAVADSGGTSRSVRHAGISGASGGYMYSNTVSPFYLPSATAFNFNYYLTNNSLTMSSSDWVFVELGINDVFSLASDESVWMSARVWTNQLATMIADIQSTVSGVRIGIGLTIPPAASQDAFGANYFSGQTRARYQRNRELFVECLLRFIDNQTTAVYAVPINAGLDTVHNFPYTDTPFNSRNSSTANRLSNGVHPAAAGYYQKADTYFSIMKGFEN